MTDTLEINWASLSPEAEKAARESAGMSNLWASRLSCDLARTQDLAILAWPSYGGKPHRAKVRRWIAEHLPQFQFNNKLNRFEAPLDQIAAAADLLPEHNVSQGAREYLLHHKETAA